MRSILAVLLMVLFLTPGYSFAAEYKGKRTIVFPEGCGELPSEDGKAVGSFISAESLEPFELLGMTQEQVKKKVALLQQSQTRTDYSTNLELTRIGISSGIGERVLRLAWCDDRVSEVGIPVSHQAGAGVRWIGSRAEALDTSINTISKTISDFDMSMCFDSQSYDVELIALLKRRAKLLELAGRPLESKADRKRAFQLATQLENSCSKELFDCYQYSDSTEFLRCFLQKEFQSFVLPSSLHVSHTRKQALYTKYGFYPQRNLSVEDELRRVDADLPKRLSAKRDFADLLLLSTSRLLEQKRLRISESSLLQAKEECDHWYQCLLHLQNGNSLARN